MVADIIADPITEIINNRILGNPIFHRFGKKARIRPSLSKVMLMIRLFMPTVALMTSLKKLKVSTVCSTPSALGLVWLSPSTKTHQDQVSGSVHQPDVSCSLPIYSLRLRISSRSLERVNLTKLLGIHFSEHLSWDDCMSTNCQKSCYSAFGILRKIENFTRDTYLAITPAKLKLSPVRLGTGWVMNIVLKVPT